MKFPYAISNFEKLITENYFYIDRTDRIPLIERKGEQLIFLRPRRFGKSLLLSMLENYYDIAQADKFEQLFGHLKIGQNPTEKHNQYFVLKFDFSAVLGQGSIEDIKRALFTYMNNCIEEFKVKYNDYLDYDIQINTEDALASLRHLTQAVSATPHKLYLFIDEYDNFANDVMASQVYKNQRYEQLVYGEGLLKTVFKNIKLANTNKTLDRVFITGVSPVVLADISSGYNVVEGIYRLPEFNDLCGFHEQEIADILKQVIQQCQLSEPKLTEALDLMRQFYNGYSFCTRSQNIVYNPTLALYFLKYFAEYCEYPENMLDHNLAMDRNRITYVSQLLHGDKVIKAALDDSKPLTVPQLHDRFGVTDMLETEQEPEALASLLYYLGVLTFDEGKTAMRELKLRIPNLVIRSLYVEKLRDLILSKKIHYQDYKSCLEAFFLHADLQPMCEFLQTRINVLSNRDYAFSNELTIKMAFLSLLFDDRLYIVDSEPELDRRYADLSLIARPDTREYDILDHIIEFKFISPKNLNLTGEQANQLPAEQLFSYPEVQAKISEAEKQLKYYQSAIVERYHQHLDLHLHVVVAVGFEKLLWQKLA